MCNISVSELTPSQVSANYINGINDVEVRKYLSLPKKTYLSREDLVSFVKENESDVSSFLYGIWDIQTNLHVGNVRIHDINHKVCYAFLGICIFDKTYWGKGIAKNAIDLVLLHAVNKHCLKRIYAGVYKENVASIKLFEKSGFIKLSNTDFVDGFFAESSSIRFVKNLKKVPI